MGTHTGTSTTHDDHDSVVMDIDTSYEEYYDVRDPTLHVLQKSYLHGLTLKGEHVGFVD